MESSGEKKSYKNEKEADNIKHQKFVRCVDDLMIESDAFGSDKDWDKGRLNKHDGAEIEKPGKTWVMLNLYVYSEVARWWLTDLLCVSFLRVWISEGRCLKQVVELWKNIYIEKEELIFQNSIQGSGEVKDEYLLANFGDSRS